MGVEGGYCGEVGIGAESDGRGVWSLAEAGSWAFPSRLMDRPAPATFPTVGMLHSSPRPRALLRMTERWSRIAARATVDGALGRG